MKKILIATTALGAVIMMMISGIAMGLDTEQETDDQEGDDPMISKEIGDLLPDPIDEGTTDQPLFLPVVKRSYSFLTTDFNKKNCHWDMLPYIKNIHGSEDHGQWMLDLLEKIGEEEWVNVTDRDDDGIPEKVVVTRMILGPTEDEDPADLSGIDPEVWGSSATIRGGYIFTYIDRDDDANPEAITLKVGFTRYVDIDGDGTPEHLFRFRWNGYAKDMDDDGAWDKEGYRVRSGGHSDRNGDGIPELKYCHNASYFRFDRIGRPIWDIIVASSSSSSIRDRNSDSFPEMIEKRVISGSWIDRNGNGWPNRISISIRSGNAIDSDSDGIVETKDMTKVLFRFQDRDDDTNPESVHLIYKKVTAFDRDDDGDVDVIRTITKVFQWMDRDSDGVPEIVRRASETLYSRPTDNHRESIKEKLNERVREKRGPNGNDGKPEKPYDDLDPESNEDTGRNRPVRPTDNADERERI